MCQYMIELPRSGLGRRLRTKTSPDGPIVVYVVDLSPYLDLLYAHVVEDPSCSVEKLSATFVADHQKFFEPNALKEAIARIKRRHAIFQAWRAGLDREYGLMRAEGLPSIEAPKDLASMSEYDFCLIFRL